MRKCLAILSVVILGINILSQVGLLAKYEISKGYITQKYCVNKAKPAMKCNGKCHLSQELKKNEENANKNPQGIEEIKLISLYFYDRYMQINLNFVQSTKHFTRHVLGSYLTFLPTIYHPPIASK